MNPSFSLSSDDGDIDRHVEEVCKALNLIKNTKEQYRSKDLISYLVGKENNLLRSHNVKENSLFGCGKENSSIFWNSLIRHMLVHGLISKNIETYGVIKLNKLSEKYLNNPTDFYISENHKYEALTELSTNSKIKSSNDKVLFKILILLL